MLRKKDMQTDWMPRGISPEALFGATDDTNVRWLCDQYDIPCEDAGIISGTDRSRILGAIRGHLASIPMRDRILDDLIWAHNRTPGNRKVSI